MAEPSGEPPVAAFACKGASDIRRRGIIGAEPLGIESGCDEVAFPTKKEPSIC